MEWEFMDYLPDLTILRILSVFIIAFIIHRVFLVYRLPPGPFGLPFVGYSVFIDPKAPYKTFDELGKKYGKIFCLQIGSVRVVCLSDYKLIKSAFAKDVYAGRPPLPVTHGIMKGYGILGAEGLWWSEQRRFFTQSLRHLGASRNSLDHSKIQQKIQTEVDFCMQQLEKHQNGLPFNFESTASLTFGNIISQLVFGCRFPTNNKDFQRQLQLLDEGFKKVSVMGTINFFPFLRFLPHFRGVFKNLLKSKDEHHQFLRKQIVSHENTLDPDNPRDYLDLFLIEMKKENKQTTFIDAQLIHSLADCFGAGIETSKVTFQWLILFLMTNLDVQVRIRKEIDKVGGDEKQITFRDASSMPYVEAVIMETQRLANLVPLGAPPGTLKDSQLEGYFIPSGTMMIGLLWSVHMNPELWPQPEVFNTDRRRICPGEDLAKMEIFLLLVEIVRKYIILPPEDRSPDLEPQMGFTLTPLPYELRLIPVLVFFSILDGSNGYNVHLQVMLKTDPAEPLVDFSSSQWGKRQQGGCWRIGVWVFKRLVHLEMLVFSQHSSQHVNMPLVLHSLVEYLQWIEAGDQTTFLLFVFVTCLLSIRYFYANSRRQPLPPGPRGVPFLGYLPFLKESNTYLQLDELAKKFGPMFRMQMGFEVKSLLSNMMTEDGKALDLYVPLATCSANVISSLLMSVRFESSDPKFRRLLFLMDEGFRLFSVIASVNFIPALQYIPGVKKAYRTLMKNRDEMFTFLRETVDTHKKSHQLNSEIRDFIDIYLEEINENKTIDNKKKFNESQLHQILADLLTSGMETTRVTLQWFILHVAANEDVRRKIQNELDTVIGRNRLPNIDDMGSLPYTEAVICETQRISNVLAIAPPHATSKDTTLNGYFVPRDTLVLPLLYSVHKNEKVWKDAENFDPTRFLSEDGTTIQRHPHFIPFGIGRRQCLGLVLARMELFSIGASILHQFDVSLPDGCNIENMAPVATTTLSPPPHKINISSRSLDLTRYLINCFRRKSISVYRIVRVNPSVSFRQRYNWPKWNRSTLFCCGHLKIRIKILLTLLFSLIFLILLFTIRRDVTIDISLENDIESDVYVDKISDIEKPDEPDSRHCIENGKILELENETCKSQRYIGKRGSYTVLYNYILAKKRYYGNQSITFCTHATYHLLPHVEVICRKWHGPISVAVHASGFDFSAALHVISFLRTCGNPCVRNSVTFHLIFDNNFSPPFRIDGNLSSIDLIIPSFSNKTTNHCKKFSSPVLKTPRNSFKNVKRLVYPINVARNVARETSTTFFVLTADIELYPSRGIVPMFLDLVTRLSDTVLRRPNPKVFVLPIFEVPRGSRPPNYKSELAELYRLGRAIFFHKYVCPPCSFTPRLGDWLKQTPHPNRIKVFHVAKRHPPYHRWEPVYIGTHNEPSYDERLTWEGKQDKMSQMHALCLLDYDLNILDNAFLVHAPGIKQSNIHTALQYQQQKKQNDQIHHQVVQNLNNKFGKRQFCI
uniref:Cytochrome P450 n=1 Tax=Strigamia maritima TaxID=126957 RepID=T1JBZ4_STRMM